MSMKQIVGFSGGADSQATAILVRRQFDPEDVILLFSDAGGNEHPITYDFVRRYSEEVFPVTFVTPIVADMAGRKPKKIAELGLSPDEPLTFDLMAKIKGKFPASKSRFCTTHLKLEPQLRWTRANREGLLAEGFERHIGVRRDESHGRSMVDSREFDDLFMCWLNRPLAAYSKEDVFDLIREEGEEYNPLYEMGFGRVGCAPCINSSKGDIRLWAARFPEMIDKIRKWEENVGRTFFGLTLPDGKSGRTYGTIDEIVAWSRTKHGGKEPASDLTILEADVASGVCMSKYGLCE